MGKEKGRILCVEDDKDFCELLTVALPDYEIENAANKAEALEKARQLEFVLIFLETYQPDGTGEELCRQIRYFDQKTPILFITASRSFAETTARSIGAQGVLKKTSPTFIDELRERTAQLARA